MMKAPTSSISRTGQDLIGSTVRLDRSNCSRASSSSLPNQGENLSKRDANCENVSSNKIKCCSICSETTGLNPISIEEMNILVKCVLNPEQLSLILLTQDHPPIFCCKMCSSTILSLMKLKTEIDIITTGLRAVISSRGGLFNQVNKNSTINESSNEDVSNSFHCDEYLTGLSQEQLTEFPEEEEEVEEDDFFIKVESTEENDTYYDPLTVYEPEAMEDDDSLTNSRMSESGLNAEPVPNSTTKLRYECEKCQVTFSKAHHLRRHLNNKNIHPVPPKPFSFPTNQFSSKKMKIPKNGKRKTEVYKATTRPTCVTCDKTFALMAHVHRHVELDHFLDKTFCPYGCPLQFRTEADWLTHLEQCNSTKMSNTTGCICRHCRIHFRNIFLRMEHYVRFHKDVMHPCRDCEHVFSSKDVLDRHRRARHYTALTLRLENIS